MLKMDLRNLRKKKLKKLLSAIADEWLQLRYGIMPLILSVQDVLKLLDEKGDEFKTVRSRIVLDLDETADSDFLARANCFYETVRGKVIVGAVAKARFDTNTSRLIDQVQVNLFATAWELIPLSFVVDWFLNIGNALTAWTSNVQSRAIQVKYCVAVRRNTSCVTMKRSSYTDNYEHHVAPWGEYVNGKWYEGRPAVDVSKTQVILNEQPAKTVLTDTYERTLFTPVDIELTFNPSLSELRIADAAALSFNLFLKRLF